MKDFSIGISETVAAFGQSHFLRTVAVPFASDVEALAKEHPIGDLDSEWPPQSHARPQADVTVLDGVLVVALLLRDWGAKKALDELYASKLRPLLQSAVSTIFHSNPPGKKYAVSVLISKAPERTSILIAAVGSTLEDVERSEKQISSVAADGLRRAERLAVSKKIHLYIIENGSSNKNPWVYESHVEAMEHLKEMKSAKPPKLLNKHR